MMLHFIQTIALALMTTQISTENKTQYNNTDKPEVYFVEPNLFLEFMNTYDPVAANEDIKKQLKQDGISATGPEMFHKMLEKIDPTDDLLKLKVQNGKISELTEPGGRRQWVPPKGLTKYAKEPFGLKARFFELMKQSVYQTRNKMVIMQIMREKYRNRSVYKMGYLTGKTDMNCKIFGKVARLAYDACSIGRAYAWQRHNLFENLSYLERLINLWFQTELLVELIVKNDINLHKVMDEHNENRAEKWEFID